MREKTTYNPYNLLRPLSFDDRCRHDSSAPVMFRSRHFLCSTALSGPQSWASLSTWRERLHSNSTALRPNRCFGRVPPSTSLVSTGSLRAPKLLPDNGISRRCWWQREPDGISRPPPTSVSLTLIANVAFYIFLKPCEYNFHHPTHDNMLSVNLTACMQKFSDISTSM